jgi:protein-S-isoprenylcysteine O-methyltransferase Ste14
MKATALEFKFRFLIIVLLCVIGFVAPWNFALHFDTIRTWQLLAATVSRLGWMSFSTATIAFLALGIWLAVGAALLRTWGSAYLGVSVVKAASLQGEEVMAAGPYRWFRNPLYAGTFLNTLALALLMPPSGAVFAVVTIASFQLRLLGAEEAFLTARLGESYLAYRARVPSLLPRLRPGVVASAVQPRWLTGVVGEIYFWGAAASFAILGWRYNAQLVIQGVIISLGVSIVVRAFLPGEKPVAQE